MRTAVCLLLLIASAVSAFTDFHGLSGPHKRVELSDGTVHLSQDVHHKFEEHGTFFKATYSARHEAKWQFVELSTLDPHFSLNFRCGSVDSTDDIELRRPSEAMLKAFESVKSGNIIVTASPQFHCHSKPIFRHLVDLQVTSHSVILKTSPAAYESVFQDLKVTISTNHVFQSSRNSSSTSSAQPLLLTHTRGFHTQHWWHHFTSAVSRAVHTVAHTLSHAATDVGHTVVAVAKTVVAVVGGDYSKDGVWNLPGIHYNKDASGAISAKQIVHADYSAGASFDLTPTIHFDLDIHTWRLRNLEVYFEGDAEASLSAHFGATLQKTISDSRQVVDIQLDPISFMIGVVPIVIKPSIPINVGFELNIDGQLEVGATLQASGSVKHGFAYSPSTGHRTISDSSFTFTHDFNPKTYSVSVGVTAWVQPVLTVSIDGILHGGVGAAIYADVLVQSNPQCIFDLTVNARPVVSVMASIGVSIAGHDIFDESWGPLTVWTHTYPLYAYCKPNPFQSVLSSRRSFDVQNASTLTDNSSAVTVTQTVTLVNRKVVNRTILTQLDDGNIGKIWTGRAVSCGTTDLHYSLRFALGDTENSSLVILTVTKVRPSLVAMGEGYATATAQIYYQSPSLPAAGVMQTYVVTNQSDAYISATNETEMAVVIPTTFTLIFSPSDIRYASMDSALTCGPVSLEAPEINDNEKVFNLLGASANPAAASDSVDSTSSSNAALIAVIAVASTLTVVAIIAAVFIHRKRAATTTRVPEQEEKMQNLSSLLNDVTNEKEESGEI
jgi:hypothetical protein